MAAAAATAGPSTSTSVLNVTDNKKRWMVFGLALNVLVDHIRPFEEKEIQTEYTRVKTNHGIDSQSTSGRLTHWPTYLKYENINGNDAIPKMRGKYNYSAFDCRVTSHVDFAKLYLENYMAKFTMFNERCEASAVLILLGKVPVFSALVQNAANNVRQDRNAWAHCVSQDWDAAKFRQSFQSMETLVNALGMPAADKTILLDDLKVWERTGPSLCMNASVDPKLLRMVQQHVIKLTDDVDNLIFDVEFDKAKLKKSLQDIRVEVEELAKRLSVVEGKVEIVEQRVTELENQRTFPRPQISIEIANCEGEISFFAARHDPDTRQWLFEDFNKWFLSPGDSRAYVLLGDAGVGKSVIAGALAQRARNAGYLGAAYFCRHNDGTRNDPRNLLGTIASQLCKCNVQYGNIVGGEGGVRMMLANSKLGVLELFTKLLQEPLGKCTPCEQRILVIIDALDETEYESRDDFLDLLMHRFPRLPKWLLFFITSRPEDTVQSTLQNYHPCIKICAGSDKHLHVYQQHEQDLKRFLEKRVDFSRLPYTEEDITKKCSGLFLYAFYMVDLLSDLVRSGNVAELNELFPGNIDDFFRENFKRIFDKVGKYFFRKLFGCVVVAPSPLPWSFITFLLKREKLNLDEQEVIDTVSVFLVFRASDQTYSFLHNLIPSWLTDLNKARRFYIDKEEAGEYFKKIVLEFLSSTINVASKKHSSIETGLLNYFLRVGVHHVLECGYQDKDSMKIVYNCLKSYQFIQKRIENSPIEVCSVIYDLNCCQDDKCKNLGASEKEILREVCRCLERNIHTLLECPHLLPSCLQTASKDGKLNMTIPDEVSTTRMECSWLPCPAPNTTDVKTKGLFALSPDKNLLAEVKGGQISLFNTCSLERLLTIEIEEVKGRVPLAFSPDGDFVFCTTLHRAFSVKRKLFEAYFPRENYINELYQLYQWCSFTLDQQHIVVKCVELPAPTCWLCLLNYLCLWAKEEIAQSPQGSKPLCRCFPDKLTVTRKLPNFDANLGPCITAMRPLLDLLSKESEEWCSLLEKVQLDGRDGTFLLSSCPLCKSASQYEALSLKEVRQFIIDHYSQIFKYQVLDALTGKPVLNESLSSGDEMSPFIYLCHLGTAFEVCGTLFTGIDKALSLSSIALLSTICHHLLFRRTNHFKRIFERTFRDEIAAVNDDLLLYSTHTRSLYAWFRQTGTHTLLSSQPLNTPADCRPLSTFTFTNVSDDTSCEAADRASILASVSPTMTSELRNLPHESKKVFFCGSIPCFSPNETWLAKPLSRQSVSLFRGRSKEPKYRVPKVARFSFTNDHLLFVYLSVNNSLHVLSLRSGTSLQSVSGVIPVFIFPEGQAGYHFQADDEGETILLKDVPCDFLQSFFVPSVKKPIQANFVSVDAVLVLCADSTVMSFEVTDDRCANTPVFELSSEFSLSLEQCSGPQHVKKGAFSPDGNLIAAHHAAKITLHNTIGCCGTRFVCSVFEADYEFSVVQLTFSADSALLLFGILQGGNRPFVYVWDVKKKVISASFDSPGILSENFCCCFSSDNQVVLCAELYIEIWDHAASTCHLLTRLAIDVLYSEADKITYCTVAPENDLLACCIVDRIYVYSLDNLSIQLVLKLPRAHLGKIEFCRFLKGNRYIISYSIDGALFLWDLPERRAVSFIRTPHQRENITFVTVSSGGDKVVGCTSFGQLFAIKLYGLKSEMLSLQCQPQRMMREHSEMREHSARPAQAVCPNAEQIAEDTDISKLVEEMDYMCPSDPSDDSDEDETG